MTVTNALTAAALAAFLAMPAFGADIVVKDAYARASSPVAKTGAAFMVFENTGDTDDQLIDARSNVSKKTELHTHIDAGGGVMQMRRVEGGFAIPAHGTHLLARGGDHVMMMGLTQPLKQGDVVTLTLVFEKAGEMVIDVPVDLERKGPMAGHGTMDHGTMTGMDN